jgi:hypothetical protein
MGQNLFCLFLYVQQCSMLSQTAPRFVLSFAQYIVNVASRKDLSPCVIPIKTCFLGIPSAPRTTNLSAQ